MQLIVDPASLHGTHGIAHGITLGIAIRTQRTQAYRDYSHVISTNSSLSLLFLLSLSLQL